MDEKTLLNTLKKSFVEKRETVRSSKDEKFFVIWGVDLLKITTEEVSSLDNISPEELILLKYIRASDLDLQVALDRIFKTLEWREEFKVHNLESETFPEAFDKAGFLHQVDANGRPVMYNIYGGNENIFEDLQLFLRWRINLMETGIKLFDFKKVSTMIQVHDYDGVGMFSSNDKTKSAARETIKIFADHYPELLSKKFFINVPWYMAGFYNIFKPIIPARTTEKFVICSSSYQEQMLEFIPVENLPIEYGGMSKTGRPLKNKIEVIAPKEIEQVKATKIEVPARDKKVIDIKIEKPGTIYIEIVIVEGDADFGCHFKTESGKEESFQKARRIITGSGLDVTKFELKEPGTITVTFDNWFSLLTSKVVYYRYLVVDSSVPSTSTSS